MFKNKSQKISTLLIILLAVIARLIPHPPNLTPIGGLALFSGNKFDKKYGFLIPLFAMLISDIFLGFHSTILFVYFSFFIIFIVGRFSNLNKVSNIFLGSLSSSILFFLITNFGSWLTFSMYPKTIFGLSQAYVMGLPFLKNTLIGDLIFSFSFFYGYKLVTLLFLRLSQATNK